MGVPDIAEIIARHPIPTNLGDDVGGGGVSTQSQHITL